MPNRAINLKKTLSVTQELILGSNPRRVYALLVKVGIDEVYLSMGEPATADQGIPLLTSGSNYEINLTNPWHGEIYAVAKTGTPTLLIVEW